MTDWLITLPKTTSWAVYERELVAAAAGEVLNYRVRHHPGVAAGDRVFLVWDGRVRGWMEAVGVERWPDGFVCSTTGICWPPGIYVQRSGPFHAIDGGAMRGFRGIRRFTLPEETT